MNFHLGTLQMYIYYKGVECERSHIFSGVRLIYIFIMK